MYALKPVVSLPEKIALPSVMYELARIQGGSASCKTEQGAIAADIAEQVIRFSKVSPLFSHSDDSANPRSSRWFYAPENGARSLYMPPGSCLAWYTCAMDTHVARMIHHGSSQLPGLDSHDGHPLENCMKLPEYNVLEARQVKILKQIYELKQQVECLCVAVRLSDVNNPAKVLNKLNLDITADEAPIHAEIIVSANPNSPPYSILALQRLWKDTKFNVEVHRHSTVSDATTQAFEEKLLSDASKDAVHSIDVTLIWKDVSDVQLVTKVYDYPLEGEANVLRYLTRLIENYNYEKSPSVVHTIDSILDLCLRLSYEEARNVNAITSKIASYLDKKTWLLDGSNASIADVAAWSVLKRVASNRVPRELKNWSSYASALTISSLLQNTGW
ncbi:hypothetical protein TSAR_014299 [Trichomalopsis sarcophagae]|uniref:AIMP2 thioredoxin-like domain-containing protein n=1 Tax=Trichomalopsis sarcophagae TaxID=543379 RepID=A0A232FHM8_9HYME|nr:hypothetical protein TSAR_014299 [Trichomalopsis sarcophagae]